MPQVLKQNDASGTDFMAKELFNERKFEKAFPMTLQADRRDPEILYNLGFMYYFGKGVRTDRKTGMEYVRKADAAGCRYADKVLRWMIFDMRERRYGLAIGLFCGLLAIPFAWRSGTPEIFSALMRCLGAFAAAWFLAFNLFSVVWSACNRYFMYMGERIGMFFFSLIGIVVGGGLAMFLFAVITAFFLTVTPENKALVSSLGSCLLLAGAVIGFRLGGKAGSCIGESAVHSITTHE